MMDKESERYNLCLKAAKNEIDRQEIKKPINSRKNHMVYLDGYLDLGILIREILGEADRFSRNNITGDLYKNYGEL